MFPIGISKTLFHKTNLLINFRANYFLHGRGPQGLTFLTFLKSTVSPSLPYNLILLI